jgi:hypothetical protein
MTYGGLRAAVFIGAVRSNAVFETSTGKAVLSFYGRQLKFICRMGTSGKDLVPAIRRYFGILSPLVLAAKNRARRVWSSPPVLRACRVVFGTAHVALRTKYSALGTSGAERGSKMRQLQVKRPLVRCPELRT